MIQENSHDPNTWGGVIAELLDLYKINQSELARRIKAAGGHVSQQTISVWLAGKVEVPTIQTVHAVYQLSGGSMLRLISVAYGWPLKDVAQHAVIDAAMVDEALLPNVRNHLRRQYNYLLLVSRAARAAGLDDIADDADYAAIIDEAIRLGRLEPPSDDV